MEYVRLCESLANGKPNNTGTFIPSSEDIHKYITNPERAYYVSCFRYNQAQFDDFKKSGSISGIRDVATSKLYWDFDSVDNLELARKDAVALCSSLISNGASASALQICFSGSKGFSVELDTKQEFTPNEVRNIAHKLAKELATFDDTMYDAARVFRVPGTRHKETGLYKYPLTLKQLSDLSIPHIKELAADRNTIEVDLATWVPAALPKSIEAMRVEDKPTLPTRTITDSDISLDFKSKPKGFSNCKFAIMNGHYPLGRRSYALMALAATCKAQGFPKEVAYNMLKASSRLQSIRHNNDPMAKGEIYNNIIQQVYGDRWNGAQYSCKTQGWLKDICDGLGVNRCTHDTSAIMSFKDISGSFTNYVDNIDKNTIKTGIPSLDRNIFLSTGANVGIVGAPGSGKTSLALTILNNTSKTGVKSVFASLDMHRNRIYEKLMYKVSGGISRDTLYGKFKSRQQAELVEKVNKEYGNVYLFDRTMPTVADLREYILEVQEQTGDKIKLVVIDYFERLFSDISDDTAASKKIAAQIQDLVLDLDVCVVTLLQPNKASGGVAEPIMSYTNIKGSSYLYQSMRIIFGVYREGYNPKLPGNDKYLTVNVLKNDLGELASLDYLWKPRTGDILELDDEGHEELETLRKQIAVSRVGSREY